MLPWWLFLRLFFCLLLLMDATESTTLSYLVEWFVQQAPAWNRATTAFAGNPDVNFGKYKIKLPYDNGCTISNLCSI